MTKTSAGLLMYRFQNSILQVFLAHPGGPLWTKKDAGAWTIPKGLIDENEDPLEAARREFKEETGFCADGHFMKLSPVKLKSGKIVHAWAFEQDFEPPRIKSNLFSMEWPPHSGKKLEFPEIDRAEWFGIDTAKEKINPGQLPLVLELCSLLKRKQ
jgi:predicted NUDIX family NTP pyrophosphohydrolase